jgi:hypothetical protein
MGSGEVLEVEDVARQARAVVLVQPAGQLGPISQGETPTPGSSQWCMIVAG